MGSATENPVLLTATVAPSIRSQGVRDAAAWAGAIFLSAFLLFQVQPLLAKIILPWFGGGAGVWTTSLVFFQVAYLLGNAYAHWLMRFRTSRWPARLHVTFLALSLLLLPILPSSSWKSGDTGNPALRIFGLLAVSVGLPFVLLSATSPLLQAWYAQSDCGKRPYRFYALSNAGSLLALLSYPALVEPHSTTPHQAMAWSYAYGLFAAVCAWIAFRRRGTPPAPQLSGAPPSPDWKKLLLWAALAADASALLLAVTSHISQDVAAVPLLWVVPLSLYLLSLIICFDSTHWYQRPFFLRFLAVALAGMTYALAPDFANAGPSLQIPLFCIGLFICCMVCHGELARLKPEPRHLTIFYLMIAAGGSFGGVFAGVIAPLIFHGFYELPIALTGCAIITLVCVTPPKIIATPPRRISFFGFATIVSFVLAFLPYLTTPAVKTSSTMRNFYGVVRVQDVAATANQPARRDLINGTIVHGIEILESGRSNEPTTYYGAESGAAIALSEAHKRGGIRVGIIGLGAGTLAAYGQPGDRFTFFEINPLVIQVANSQFDFLRDSKAHIDMIPGDARISLEHLPSQNFDLLMADAFSGDAIPVHLLTRESFELYFRHLKPDGLLAIHISNKFLDLKPVVEAAAQSLGVESKAITNDADQKNYVYTATWVLLYREGSPFAEHDNKGALPHWIRSNVVVRPWTDDYSSLLKVLR
jgi:SAM-dependent methyltransferase